LTTDLLCDAIGQAAAAVAVPVDTRANPAWHALTLRFGAQVDTKPIRHGDDLPGTGGKLSVQAVGNYIAKYVTKDLDAPGGCGQSLRAGPG
jgi:hypothetical protein